MRICCFYFILPFISMPTRSERLGVDKCVFSHIHMHTVPLSLARVRATHTQSLVHWVRTPIVSLLCMAHPPFATNPCPFHTKLPVGKLIIFTPHSLD